MTRRTYYTIDVRGPTTPGAPLAGINAGKRFDAIISCRICRKIPTGPRNDGKDALIIMRCKIRAKVE